MITHSKHCQVTVESIALTTAAIISEEYIGMKEKKIELDYA